MKNTNSYEIDLSPIRQIIFGCLTEGDNYLAINTILLNSTGLVNSN